MLHDDYETTVDWWVFVFPKPDKVSLMRFSSPTSFVVWTTNLYFSLWEDFVAAIKTWSFITNISHESHLIRATKYSSLSPLYLLASSTLFGYFFEEISSVFTVATGCSEIPLYASLYTKRTLTCERIRPWVYLFIFFKIITNNMVHKNLSDPLLPSLCAVPGRLAWTPPCSDFCLGVRRFFYVSTPATSS